MANVYVDIEILEPNKSSPIGWKASSGHLLYDVKMEFTPKARWIKDGQKNFETDQYTYAGFVLRYIIRIAFT